MSTTTQRTDVDHPYWGAGLFITIVALILVGFDLGVLARCGMGRGVCFDPATHGTSDAALVAFFVLFFIGLLLVLYTEASTTVTRSETPAPTPSPPQVMVVNPPSSPAPTSVTVNPNAPAKPDTTVNVNPSSR